MRRMNKLLQNIKKILNKDVSSFLNKYKIPLISTVIVVLLACIGLIVSYAFYQVTDKNPVIGGSTGKLADIEVRIMAEDRDTNGNGLNSYSLYPYIPKAGYKYNASSSYCVNGSTIIYNAENYNADIKAYGHDICYMYFDSTASLDITLNVYAENVNDDGVGTGEYTKLETTSLPSIGYEFNTTLSKCQNGSTVSYNTAENMFTVEASQKDVCDAYMDAMDVDIALKVFIQAKKNSNVYYEAKTIPTNNYYILNSKSSCTGSSTLSLEHQKVVIAATSKTNCVAYLDVGSGPILESMQAEINLTNATITLANSQLGTNPTMYYYSKDNGATYVSSTSATYTFSDLDAPATYTFKAYSVDATGNKSRIFSTSADVEYVFKGDYPYQSNAYTFDVKVSGYYKLEVWGASGGYGYNNATTYAGGKGGYSYGTVYLEKGNVVYIHTGGAGKNGTTSSSIKTGGSNGGGNSGYYRGASGGGGSDIRINSDDNLARVIVAGGGGGGANYSKYYGGYGGGASGGDGKGYNTTYNSKGGTQTAGGAAGHYGTSSTYSGTAGTIYQGGRASSTASGTYNRSGGGGGGWYGGGGGGYRNATNTYYYGVSGGGGGSGFVYTSETTTLPTGYLLADTYKLVNAQTIAGNVAFTSPTGTEETGHDGNGYAKIEYIGKSLS